LSTVKTSEALKLESSNTAPPGVSADTGRKLKSTVVVCGPRIERVPWKLPDEEVLRQRVVVKPVTGAQHVLALAGQIPRGADSRREVVHVAIVELADRRDLAAEVSKTLNRLLSAPITP
jgi:hypothetical protein